MEDVIRWVNSVKQPINGIREKNIVMGQSMGGLVARYGLAEMTKLPANFQNGRNINDPETSRLILHDSPQRGAYNPIGTQTLTRATEIPFFGPTSLADIKDDLAGAVAVLNQPATQQLSILNAFNASTDIRPNTFLLGSNSQYRTMIENVPGAAYTIVATSNGSQCGTPQNVAPGTRLAYTNLPTWFLPRTAGGFSVDFAAYALPAYGQQAEVSHAYIKYRHSACFGIGPWGVCFDLPAFYLLKERATSPANTLPYETLPGGSTNLKRESGTCAGFDYPRNRLIASDLYDGDICFVPTYSALDVDASPTFAYAQYINNTTNSPAKPSPVRFIAQEQNGSLFNLQHLTFTPRNAEWIFTEMQPGSNQNLVSCSTECTAYPSVSIIGPEGFCTSGTATYRVTPILPGVLVEWSVAPTTEVLLTPGSQQSVTVSTRNGAALNDYFTLTATLKNEVGCVLRTATLSVSAQPSELFVYYQNPASGRPPQTVCPHESVVFSLYSVNYDPTSVKWYAGTQANETYRGASLDGQQQVIFPVGNAGNFSVYATALDYCGNTVVASPRLTLTVDPNCIGVRPAQSATAALYPNPARESVDVHVEQATEPVVVRLFDSQGRQRAEKRSTGQATVTFRTDQLPTGLYFIHILRGQHVLSRQQLRIEK